MLKCAIREGDFPGCHPRAIYPSLCLRSEGWLQAMTFLVQALGRPNPYVCLLDEPRSSHFVTNQGAGAWGRLCSSLTNPNKEVTNQNHKLLPPTPESKRGKED